MKIIIVGAGILGVSHAVELSKVPGVQVTVVDAASGVAQNYGTGSSSACVRRCYSNQALTIMSDFGVRALERMQASQPSSSLFVQNGCLTVGTNTTKFLTDQRRIFTELKYEHTDLPTDLLRTTYSDLEFGDQSIGTLDPLSGYASAHLVSETQAMLARQNGAKFLFDSTVQSLLTKNGRVTGVQLSQGEELEADIVILASAVGTRALLQSVDLNLSIPTSARPIFTLYVQAKGLEKTPVIADLENQIYARPEGSGLLVGSLKEEDEEQIVERFDPNFEVSKSQVENLLERTAQRYPSINMNPGSVKVVRGLYDVNDTDWMPIQSKMKIEGLMTSFATSGHGFKLAFALAAMMAEQLGLSKMPSELTRVNSELFALDRRGLMSSGVLS